MTYSMYRCTPGIMPSRIVSCGLDCNKGAAEFIGNKQNHSYTDTQLYMISLQIRHTL